MQFLSLMMCTLFLIGCTPSFTAFGRAQDPAIDELRMEIVDLKHALQGTDVELKILEEKVEATEGRADSSAASESANLQKKIAALEKNLDKMKGEISSLINCIDQITTSLSQQREHMSVVDSKLGEISKLRSLLSELSQVSTPSKNSFIYRVREGDSLKKLALQYKVSVEALKRENKLSSDKIMIGQQLVIPLGD